MFFFFFFNNDLQLFAIGDNLSPCFDCTEKCATVSFGDESEKKGILMSLEPLYGAGRLFTFFATNSRVLRKINQKFLIKSLLRETEVH